MPFPAKHLLPLVILLALTACDSGTPEEEAPGNGTEAAAPVDVEPAANERTQAPGTTAEAIPTELQGRWGLTPTDCTAGPAAEGLLTIGPDSLEFYESTATLQNIEQSAPTAIRATFAFMGEGMSWRREMALSLEQNGTALVRQEYGEDAAEGPIRYVKCS